MEVANMLAISFHLPSLLLCKKYNKSTNKDNGQIFEKGFQKRMTTQGHLSHHLFSLKNGVKDISLEHAIRMVLNYALNCSYTEKRQEFLEEWMQVGVYIQNFVDSEHIDKFNDLFISPRNKKQAK